MEQNNIHGDNIRGDKHEHYHEASHTIPKLLTQKSGLCSDNFVGREKELAKINELLNQDSTLLLLNGIGGIGKSTLASYYFNKERDKFDYCGFIEVGEDIKSSFFSAFLTSLNLKSEKIDDSFNEVMNKLQNLAGDKLLVLDDIKNIATQKDEINTILTLKNSGFKILFTSREVEENIPQYYLDTMSKEDARKLFLQHHPTDEIEKVDRILEYLDYHTFFVEMTAKTLEKRKRTLSLNSMIKKFESGEFSNIIKDKEESFSKLLCDLFSNDKILKDEENLLFLKRLSVLPSIEISFDDLHAFLVCEDNEKLEILLNELVDNGWLIESNGMYKFHQIMKEFILLNYLPNSEEINDTIEYCKNMISKPYSYNSFYELTYNIQIGIIKTLIYSKIHNMFVIEYLINFSIICDRLQMHHDLTMIVNYLDNIIIKYSENIFVANFYENKGRYFFRQEKYKKAIYWQRKSLKLKKNIYINDKEYVAATYANIALTYFAYNKKCRSLILQKHALSIFLNEFGKYHPDCAIAYANLAKMYIDKNPLKSLEYYKEAVNIIDLTTSSLSLDKAIIYKEYGIFLWNAFNDWNDALKNFYKAREIFHKLFIENNAYIKNINLNINIVESSIGINK